MKSKAIPAFAGLLLLAAAAAWYWWPRLAPAPALPPPVAAPPTAEAPPPIAHPMPESGAEIATKAPPSLADSDASFQAALVALPGGGMLVDLLVPENLIRHIVATVDALPRRIARIDLPLLIITCRQEGARRGAKRAQRHGQFAAR